MKKIMFYLAILIFATLSINQRANAVERTVKASQGKLKIYILEKIVPLPQEIGRNARTQMEINEEGAIKAYISTKKEKRFVGMFPLTFVTTYENTRLRYLEGAGWTPEKFTEFREVSSSWSITALLVGLPLLLMGFYQITSARKYNGKYIMRALTVIVIMLFTAMCSAVNIFGQLDAQLDQLICAVVGIIGSITGGVIMGIWRDGLTAILLNGLAAAFIAIFIGWNTGDNMTNVLSMAFQYSIIVAVFNAVVCGLIIAVKTGRRRKQACEA